MAALSRLLQYLDSLFHFYASSENFSEIILLSGIIPDSLAIIIPA